MAHEHTGPVGEKIHVTTDENTRSVLAAVMHKRNVHLRGALAAVCRVAGFLLAADAKGEEVIVRRADGQELRVVFV